MEQHENGSVTRSGSAWAVGAALKSAHPDVLSRDHPSIVIVGSDYPSATMSTRAASSSDTGVIVLRSGLLLEMPFITMPSAK